MQLPVVKVQFTVSLGGAATPSNVAYIIKVYENADGTNYNGKQSGGFSGDWGAVHEEAITASSTAKGATVNDIYLNVTVGGVPEAATEADAPASGALRIRD
jgi:hypothetical protein